MQFQLYSKERLPKHYIPTKHTHNAISYDGASISLPNEPINQVHYHSLIEIGICRSGQGLCLFDNTPVAINKGDVIIVAPGVTHYSQTLGTESCMCDFVYVNPQKLVRESRLSLPDCANENIIFLPNVFRKESNNHLEKQLYSILYMLIDTAIEKPKNYIYTTAAYYMLLCLKLGELHPALDGKQTTCCIIGAKNQLYPAIEYIHTQYSKNITLSMLAKLCFMSESAFQKKFKNELTISPIHYLNQFRIEIAMEMIDHTDYTFAQIGGMIGYNLPSDFYRHFKSIAGISPSEYKKSKIFNT